MNRLLDLIKPNTSWLQLLKEEGLVKSEMIAAFIAAVIMLPQSVALATLAGMPPEYGIYASAIPVIIASLWSSSWHALSGPNTAVAIMIMTTIIPFSTVGVEFYIKMVFLLTLMVGLIQVVFAITRFGHLMNFISHSVMAGVTNAVGIIIIVSAGFGAAGTLSLPKDHFLIKVWHLGHDIFSPNPAALFVCIATIAIGLYARRFIRKGALVVAMVGGLVVSNLLEFLFGAANTNLYLLGNLDIALIPPFTNPFIEVDSAYIWKQMFLGAFAISIVGVVQTSVISKTLANKSGHHVDQDKDIMSQGLSNIAGAFFSSFAGSASFNRSHAHYESGARSPLSGAMSGVFILLVAIVGAPLLSGLSVPVMSGVLILVGWGLINFKSFKPRCNQKTETVIFYSTMISAMLFGLIYAVLIGVIMSLISYIKNSSSIQVVESFNTHEDGGIESELILSGNLFFGCMHEVEKALNDVAKRDGRRGVLALTLNDIHYLDASIAKIINNEYEMRSKEGGELVLGGDMFESDSPHQCLAELSIN